MEVKTVTIWGVFFLYATHFPQDMFRPPEKNTKKSLHWICLIFFWLLFCKKDKCKYNPRSIVSQRKATHKVIGSVQMSDTLFSQDHTSTARLRETLRILMYVKPPPGSNAARPCSKVTKCKLCYGASVWNRLIIEIEKEEGGGIRSWRRAGVGSRMQFFFFFSPHAIQMEAIWI